jgi:ubiquinone/menaquinone biosynthesis C-methylase UbiE
MNPLESARRGERLLSPALFEPLARRLLDPVEFPIGARVLDVGCGGGVVGRELARRGVAHVVGLDPNRARLIVGAHAGPRVRGLAECLPFPDASFSGLTSQHSFMFISDRTAALREALRVLRCGATAVASAWRAVDLNPGFFSLNRAVERELGAAAAASAAVPFSLPEPDRLAGEFSAAGFTDVVTADVPFVVRFPSAAEFAQRFLTSTSLAPFVSNRGDRVTHIANAVGPDLAQYVDANGVAFPALAYSVRAKKPEN